tara:strand:- start:471 stop:1082 length:612 start_codon:yes stop_codon:yes gene_type:complete
MFALVESGSITKFLSGNRGIQIGDIKHSADIFSNKWTESERNAIGIYTIEIDKTNFKDIEYYINTDITYAFGSGKVTGSYGTATAKPHADTLWTQQDKDDGLLGDRSIGDVKTEGLKTIKKREIDGQCAQILAPSDYMAIKAAEGITMDSGWKTWRGNVRTKCNSMQTAITNAADTAAIETLFTYTTTDGVTSRPLGEFPVKE